MNQDNQKIIDFLILKSKRGWVTAKSLKSSGRYSDCLFFCHLMLEYLLKASVLKNTSRIAPYIHNLATLGELANLKFDQVQKDLLKIVTSFNIRTRYDDYKADFYKKATKEYAEEYFTKCNKLKLWLLKKLQNG